MSARLDPAYMGKLTDGIMAAIIDASLVDQGGGPTAMVMNAEVIEVLTTTIAGFVAGSSCVATQAQLRQFCDQLAARLQCRIAGFQQHIAEHGAPFPTIDINPN